MKVWYLFHYHSFLIKQLKFVRDANIFTYWMKKVFNSPNVNTEIFNRKEIENKISYEINANDFGHMNHEKSKYEF